MKNKISFSLPTCKAHPGHIFEVEGTKYKVLRRLEPDTFDDRGNPSFYKVDFVELEDRQATRKKEKKIIPPEELAKQTESFQKNSRAADDKAKADLIQNTPAGIVKISGPLFGSPEQKSLF